VKVSRTYHKRRTHTVEVDREFEFSVETSDSPQAQEKSTDRDDFDSDFVGGFDFECHEDDHIHNLPEFKTLSPDDIVIAQKKQISEICELLMISASSASLLLRFYGWKPEILIEKYFHDPEKVIQQAGILVDTFDGEAEAKLVDHGECLVCTDITSPEESCALVCAHRVCVGCWSSFLTMKITDGEVYRLSCPAVGCRRAVPDEVVKKLVEKPVYEKYLRFVTKSFVEDNSLITWCPYPRCANAITTDMVRGHIVQCSCGYRFCFSCHHEAHSPASCEQIIQWAKKCSSDSETGLWLGVNTKACPNCNVYVEKNGGCNHITCRQCSYEWCWMCMKIWKGHEDYYACARYEKSQRKKEKNKRKKNKEQVAEVEREQKRIALERYIGYYDKYLEYDKYLKNSDTMKETTKKKMQLLQEEQTILAEVKFIEKAVQSLLECYAAIKYSFVYAYFLEDGSTEKEIFTYLQGELIKSTTTLAEMIECSDVLDKRTEAVDLTKLTQKKKDSLLAAVEIESFKIDTI